MKNRKEFPRTRGRCRSCGINERPRYGYVCIPCRYRDRLASPAQVLYERDRGKGVIPSNLLERYPELAVK